MTITRRQGLTALTAPLALTAWSAGATPPPPQPAERLDGEFPDERFQVGRESRRYRLVVPRTLAKSTGLPLVIALHGMGRDDKDSFPRASGLNGASAKHEFAVAYLQARRSGWGQKGADLDEDLQALDALLDALKARLPVEARRVHLLGFSSGARLALRAAAARPGRYASVVAHSTLMPVPPPSTKMPPQIWVHGERDRLSDIGPVRRAVAAALKARQRVQLITVPNLGHQWAREADLNSQLWTFMALQTLGRPD
ncbi:alpha/beta hydrolase family esterase [Inhella crocodyli]|uniref:Alpha/beta fold hydrolase n=1 Tax=Inhella crocodyli TaxID=2499851 RepID=A0A437LE83_9BURK|nr:alpha/beta fold hydrolase [Inhella crocodyli]RVT83654.1 alpha/beta fold hydrolase [Inhella crocodyli]